MKRLINVLIPILLIVGVGLVAYPTLSDWFNTLMNRQAIRENEEKVQSLLSDEAAEMLDLAREYNRQLNEHRSGALSDAFSGSGGSGEAKYLSLLDLNGDGVMGTISIPKIGVELPIYHTTGADVLKKGAGHVEGTSLPVGGASTHCALAGHRGLPSARLFTDLDQMDVGDVFYLKVLGMELTYCVDQIVVVEPEESQYLDPVAGEDLVTLVTCTPYGINTHRLLIRGKRAPQDMRPVDADAVRPVFVYAVIIALVSLCIVMLIQGRKAKR